MTIRRNGRMAGVVTLVGLTTWAFATDVTQGEDRGRVVAGTVFGSGGKSISEALVGVRSHTSENFWYWDDADADYRWAGRTGRTDEAGKFRIDLAGLTWAEDDLDVMVIADGHTPHYQQLPAESAANVEVRLKAEPWVPLRLRILDGRGRPAEGAQVRLRVGPATWGTARTDELGEARFVVSGSNAGWRVIVTEAPGACNAWFYPSTGQDAPSVNERRLPPEIHGVLRDAEGEPAPGVQVCESMTRDNEGRFLATGRPDLSTVTDKRGEFTLRPLVGLTPDGQPDKEGLRLCFLPKDDARLGYAYWSFSKGFGLEVPILRSTRPVRLEVVAASADLTLDGLDWSILPLTEGNRPTPALTKGRITEGTGRFQLVLPIPPGRYRAYFARKREIRSMIDLDVPPGSGPIDMPPARIEVIPHLRMVGRQAGEIDAVDLAGRPVHLADHRGKVVILDFWAVWCGPCIGALPELVALRRKYEGQPVEILAIHDGTVASKPEFEKKFGPIRKQHLGDRDLPFPVLLDQSFGRLEDDPQRRPPGEPGAGRTISTYGVSRWPSTFVIDQAGQLVGEYRTEELDQIVSKLLAARPKTGRPQDR